jgi:signal transduction histidine kinase
VVKLEHILTRLVDGARQALQADAAAVRLFVDADAEPARDIADGKEIFLAVAAVSGLPAALVKREAIAVDVCPIDREALAGRPVVIADAHSDPRATDVPARYRSVLCVGLAHEHVSIGTLHVYAAAAQCFEEKDVALLTPLVDLGAAAIAAARALAVLNAAEASKAHFIHVATHELRSPVAVAQSMVRGVLKGYAGAMTEKQTEVFGRVSRRLDFLESLVDDLLDLAAGKAAGAEEETAVVLNSSVGRVVLLLQPRAEEKGVDLVHRACCEELVVRGTEEGLDRIFVNLVGNAVKYTPAGGSVDVVLQRVSADDIEVKVIDTGIGIPEKAMMHLFEEFYRAPNAKASDEVGTGLGLAIVKDLVSRYGGRIEVESAAGQGSTFTVTFPVLHLDEIETFCRLPGDP